MDCACMTYLGAQGMFIGFLVAWLTVKVEKWCVEKDVRIKMPDVCPPALVNGFSAILPLLFTVLIAYGVDVIIQLISGGAMGLCSGFMPGKLHMTRSAGELLSSVYEADAEEKDRLKLMAYSYAASEENATRGTVVTAPTLGACGVMLFMSSSAWRICNVTESVE